MAMRRKTPLPFPDCGRLVKKYRTQRGFSIRELAEMIDISDKYLSSLESGYQMPSITTLYRISVKLNVPFVNLIVDLPPEKQHTEIKDLIIDSLETMTNDELELFYKFICHCIPLTRKFKEY